jgi:hypothetical protein
MDAIYCVYPDASLEYLYLLTMYMLMSNLSLTRQSALAAPAKAMQPNGASSPALHVSPFLRLG